MGATAAHRSRAAQEDVPLTALFFDVLHADGDDTLDLPLAERAAILVLIAALVVLVLILRAAL